MQKCKQSYRFCKRIISIVILMSFLMTPMFAEQPMKQSESLNEDGTKSLGQFGNELQNKNAEHFYSDSEVESLIDDLSLAAKEAIEQAGAEAAKAAALAALEQQAELLREKAEAEREAEQWKIAAETAKANGRKNVVIGVIAGLLGGLALGITGTLIISN